MANLSFGAIVQLKDQWWTSPPPNDPQAVWDTWDHDTYYLWGANSGNYTGIPIGHSLNGDGMASDNGPSRGRAHPHYVGIITMDINDMPNNDAVFKDLGDLVSKGANVVVPTFHGEWSFGTGIGKSVPDWGAIQKYLLEQVYLLGKSAMSVTIPPATYWSDWRPHKNGTQHPITRLEDLADLVKMLSGNAAAVPVTND